jgi:hypothetical protein
MSSLAIVYVDATKHIVSSTLIQSGYATPPKVADLVGTGPRIRDPATGVPAINVAADKLALKVLVPDPAILQDRPTLEGLLGNPLNYCLRLKDPLDPSSPLVPTLAQTSSSGLTLVTTSPASVALAAAASRALQLVVLVQRGSIEAAPIVSPPGTVGPSTATSPLQETLQSGDWLWVLVESWQPVLEKI